MRSASIHSKVQHLIRSAPFQPFLISLESGQAIKVAHPENIAFEPSENGSEDSYVLAPGLHLHSTFSAVTSISLLDDHAAVGGHAG